MQGIPGQPLNRLQRGVNTDASCGQQAWLRLSKSPPAMLLKMLTLQASDISSLSQEYNASATGRRLRKDSASSVKSRAESPAKALKTGNPIKCQGNWGQRVR